LHDLSKQWSAVSFYLSWLSFSYKLVKMLSVSVCVGVDVCVDICLDISHVGTNRKRCTQRLVILRAQIYSCTLIVHQKLGPFDLLHRSQLSAEKSGRD